MEFKGGTGMITEGTVTISMRDFKWLEEMAKKAQQAEWDYNKALEEVIQLKEYIQVKKEMAQQQGGNL